MNSLIEFIGYGSRDPAIVFLGIEEKDAGGGTEAADVRLRDFQSVEDLHRACTLLAQCPGFVDPFEPGAKTVPQWNMAARFRLALAGLPWHDDWDRYWRHQLGRSHGDTLLMECFHEPARGLHVRRARDDEWPRRYEVLSRFTATISPRHVIAYGAAPGRYVSSLFPVVPSILGDETRMWHPLPTRRPSTIGRTDAGTVVARVEFFGQGRFHRDDIEPITRTMMQLGGGPAALQHPWHTQDQETR